jgi:hypothetical protein
VTGICSPAAVFLYLKFDVVLMNIHCR